MAKIRYREISKELEKLASPISSQNSRVSIGFEEEVGEFYYFSIDDLIPYKKQARSIFDEEEIVKLSKTIQEHGICQPLSILKSQGTSDKYEVVSGERRLRAAKLVGLKKVPCIIIKDDAHADEISLIENIQREDLHPIELARAINVLIEGRPYGARADMGRKIGLSKSQISELLSLLTLPLDVQEALLSGGVRGRDHFRKILSLTSTNEQLNYIRSLKSSEETGKSKNTKKSNSRSIIRLSFVDEVLKVQSYGLKKITPNEAEDVKTALLTIMQQLEEVSVRGGE